nr:hypothetical protein [Pandoravirus belohorizontensis]
MTRAEKARQRENTQPLRSLLALFFFLSAYARQRAKKKRWWITAVVLFVGAGRWSVPRLSLSFFFWAALCARAVAPLRERALFLLSLFGLCSGYRDGIQSER